MELLEPLHVRILEIKYFIYLPFHVPMTHNVMNTISRAAGRDCRNDDAAIAEYVVANYEQLVC